MKRYNRAFLIVLDSVGVGELADANEYGDFGVNTLCNIAKHEGGLTMPNMEKMGLGNIVDIEGVKQVDAPIAFYTKSNEQSKGKDTITGHWEMMGMLIEEPFKAFTDTGFPKELIDELEEKTGYKYIGNKSASGTGILDELGERHCETKDLIIYTSADSVLQIAANEDVIGLEELYRVCEIAREITLKEEYRVGRVIARPFVGTCKENFKRTSNRRDYALEPERDTVLDILTKNGIKTVGIGKIKDIYAGRGISESIKTKSNEHGMNEIINIAKNNKEEQFVFLNLVDFDALYGHRRDIKGYKECLESFDKQLGELLDNLDKDDLLIITADHGNDPTYKGTDHTREWVPVIVYNSKLEGKRLNILDSMSDMGMSILENFGMEYNEYGFKVGKSFLNSIK